MLFLSYSYSGTLNNIEINGNDRISDETIKIFIDVNINEEIDNNKLNNILNNLYETDFFEDVNLKFIDQNLIINVIENPIIENISYEGVKNKKTLSIITENALVKSRSSFNKNRIKKEKINITNILKELGYYNSSIDVSICARRSLVLLFSASRSDSSSTSSFTEEPTSVTFASPTSLTALALGASSSLPASSAFTDV